MSGTITSLLLSFIGLVCLIVAFKDGTNFDMRTLIICMAGFSATICSWLARIEASIDKMHVKEEES